MTHRFVGAPEPGFASGMPRGSWPTMSEPPPSRLVSVLLLGAVVLAGLLLWRLFPLFQGWVNHQDCVALGRTDCG